MPDETRGQPTLSDLMANYLQKQAGAHAAGLATFDAAGEVVPFEAGPVQPVDPLPAWTEAVTALNCFVKDMGNRPPAPPHWPQLVAAQEPTVALALCAGNFPQMMRNFHLLLHRTPLAKLLPSPGRPISTPGLVEWANQVATAKQYPQMVLALGTLRLARQFDQAQEYSKANEAVIPSAWRPAWANEQAALAWHAGRTADADRLWQQLPESVPVLFNRGMAALFLGRPEPAKTFLTQAVAQLPETGAWHHLGRLYLALV